MTTTLMDGNFHFKDLVSFSGMSDILVTNSNNGCREKSAKS
jgi:hypothetical protein